MAGIPGTGPALQWKVLAAIFGIYTSASASHGQTVPPPLLGKSVIVTFDEVRQQRIVGMSQFTPVSSRQQMSIYISTAGRLFSRWQSWVGDRTGASDQIAGQSQGSRARVLAFEGQRLLVMAPFPSGAVRQLRIGFSGGLRSCVAQVRYAKKVGQETSRMFSIITKQMYEVASASISHVRCVIRPGQPFGDE